MDLLCLNFNFDIRCGCRLEGISFYGIGKRIGIIIVVIYIRNIIGSYYFEFRFSIVWFY